MSHSSIKTNVHQVQKPGPIVKDSRGSKIRIGADVAYNRSGEVSMGRIVSIKRNEWKATRDGVDGKKWWSLKFEAIIENTCCNDCTESIVRNPNSFIIL